MPSLINRLKAFTRTPQGQRLMNQAQRELSKPGNQQKLRKLSERLRGSGGRRHY